MSTVNQNIIAKLLINFGNISIANGYSFDINGHVYEWRETPPVDAELPLINIKDPAHRFVDSDENPNENELDIEIDFIAAPGDDSPADVRDKKQDIMNAFKLIENESYITGAQYIDSELLVDHDKRKYAGSTMRFKIWYATDRWSL